MSGFSAEWLALREPADHRARDAVLLRALAQRFAARDEVRVVDLGCGTGSNLRACAAHLPPRQHWRLVDSDAALLAAARNGLVAWADRGDPAEDGVILRRGGQTIAVSFVRADLAADLDGALGPACDLVTAAALFDLVSVPWIERFAAGVRARRAACYAALTYDGREEWRPPHPADKAVTVAFQAHQRGDKGFGPAAGPDAGAALAQAFTAAGYDVRSAASPWRLGPDDTDLVNELATGVATAVRETGQVPDADVASWLGARGAGATVEIGHTDMLALPVPRPTAQPG